MAQSEKPTARSRLILGVLKAIAALDGSRSARRSRFRAEAPQRILVIELWNIGDVVLTMPFLAELRRRFPKASVTLLARPHARLLLAGTNLVDEFIEADLTWKDTDESLNPLAYDWRALQRAIAEVRRRKFDLVFQARPHLREHVLVALSRAPRRVGLMIAGDEGALSDAIPPTEAAQRKYAQWLALLEPFGGSRQIPHPRLSVSPAEREWAQSFLRDHGIRDSVALIGVHPGASIAAKRWPLDRFRQLTEWLALQDGVRVMAFIDPEGYGAPLAEIPNVVGVSVDLREMISLIDRASLLVCNDSGPMHIAAALGVPTAAVFGHGIDQWFAPFGEHHQLITSGVGSPDRRNQAPGVAEVPVSAVQSAVKDLLASIPPRRSAGREARLLQADGPR